jgi:hypothetical protein
MQMHTERTVRLMYSIKVTAPSHSALRSACRSPNISTLAYHASTPLRLVSETGRETFKAKVIGTTDLRIRLHRNEYNNTQHSTSNERHSAAKCEARREGRGQQQQQ